MKRLLIYAVLVSVLAGCTGVRPQPAPSPNLPPPSPSVTPPVLAAPQATPELRATATKTTSEQAVPDSHITGEELGLALLALEELPTSWMFDASSDEVNRELDATFLCKEFPKLATSFAQVQFAQSVEGPSLTQSVALLPNNTAKGAMRLRREAAEECAGGWTTQVDGVAHDWRARPLLLRNVADDILAFHITTEGNAPESLATRLVVVREGDFLITFRHVARGMDELDREQIEVVIRRAVEKLREMRGMEASSPTRFV